MKETTVLIEKFKQFGVAERETKIYLALLEHGEANANDVHRITGLQRTKIYSVLARMVVHGLCHERIEGRNRFFTAVSPKEVLGMLKHQWRSNFADLEERAENVLLDLEKNYPLQQNGAFLNSVEVIRNKTQIHQRYLTLVNESKKEILVFNRSPYAATTKQKVEEQYQAQRKALERGVHLKSIIVEKQLPDDINSVEHLGEHDEMRVLKQLPIKMFVFDRLKVLLAIPSTPESDLTNFSMVLMDDPGFASLCKTSFDFHWTKARPVNGINKNSKE